LFFQDWGEHIHREEQLLQQPFDASGTEQPLQLRQRQVAYAQVMDGPKGERELLLQRLQLRVSNDAQAVVVEWQFVGNLLPSLHKRLVALLLQLQLPHKSLDEL
jgi:hypothetical protein